MTPEQLNTLKTLGEKLAKTHEEFSRFILSLNFTKTSPANGVRQIMILSHLVDSLDYIKSIEHLSQAPEEFIAQAFNNDEKEMNYFTHEGMKAVAQDMVESMTKTMSPKNPFDFEIPEGLSAKEAQAFVSDKLKKAGVEATVITVDFNALKKEGEDNGTK